MKLKKNNNNFEIIENNEKEVLTIENNKNKISIYDKKLTEEIISNKFNEKYRRLLYIITDINSSEDTTDTDECLVREQIDELKNNFLLKYKKHISKELLNKYLKMLLILETKIVVKEKGKSR